MSAVKTPHSANESQIICTAFYPTKFSESTHLAKSTRFARDSHDSRKIDSHKSDSRKIDSHPNDSRKITHDSRKDSRKTLPNTTIIALGGNLKSPIHTFKMLFLKFRRNAKIRILSTSPIYKNPPFGFCNQPFFYNATMLLATSMCLMEFYAFIFYMERVFGRGRIRAFKNAPRTLDIDIIFFNDIVMRSAKLNIPHTQWQGRSSVLIPLIYQVNYKGQ